MSKELTDFLTDLATNDDLAKKFKADKDGTMKEFNITEEHRKLVVNKNYDEIQSILGADYDIAHNDVIKAFRK